MKQKSDFKTYLSFFKFGFIIVLIMAAAFAYLCYMSSTQYERNYYDSPNTARVHGDQRVFDYGDQLTDDEEVRLEAYIKEAEKKTCVDIVIVTLNESLAEFARAHAHECDYEVYPSNYVAVYGEKFWRDNKFGYDQPQVLDNTARTGHGVLLVDNVFREPETGRIYSWMVTVGKCEKKYSSEMIDHALDEFYDYVDINYYRACTDWVDCVVKDMSIAGKVKPAGPIPAVVIGLISWLIFYLANKNSKAASVTVNNNTYIVGNAASFKVVEDRFINKTVTKHYNPPSSSSGGGGHHSSGGGSYGGGGHSR